MRHLVCVMTCFFVATLALANLGTAFGHSDVEFGYESGKIEVEFGSEGRIFEGDFETSGIDLQRTSEPGFASEIPEFGNLNPGDEIVYNVHGPLQYWNGASIAPVAAGTQIRIENVGLGVPDTLISGTSGSQLGVFSTPNPALPRNRIADAEPNGEFHSDLDWTLEPLPGSPATGAYAVLISLSSDAPGIADSDRFFIVQNFGLGEEAFEAGVEAFAGQIPEPMALTMIGAAAVVFGLARRRRKLLEQ